MEKKARGFRAAGWIRALVQRPNEHGLLIRLLLWGSTPRGIGSPYQRVDPVQIARANPSPGRANRKLCAVKCRANQILAPYGLSVSRDALAQAAAEPLTKRGKDAFRAARRTIAGWFVSRGVPVEYACKQNARAQEQGCSWDWGFWVSKEGETRWGNREEWVTDPLQVGRGMADFLRADRSTQAWVLRGIEEGRFADLRTGLWAAAALELDTTDGVKMLLDPSTRQVIAGVEITQGWVVQNVEREGARGLREASVRAGFHVRHGSRTFHVWGEQTWNQETYRNEWKLVSVRSAIRQALDAWRKQDSAEKAARAQARQDGEIGLLLVGEHPETGALLYRRHSYAVGNCEAGTEAWIASVGFQGRRFVPLHLAWLAAKKSGESRAVAACRKAAAETLKLLAEIKHKKGN